MGVSPLSLRVPDTPPRRGAGASGPLEGTEFLEPLPLLHEEPDTPLVLDTCAAENVPALLCRLYAAPTAQVRRDVVREVLGGLGFYSLGYGRYACRGTQARALAHCTTYADVGWLQRYVCASYHRVDGRLARAMRNGVPCVWSIESLRRSSERAPADPLERAFVDDLAASGACSGAVLAFPVAAGTGRDVAPEVHVVSVAARRIGTQWLDDAVLGRTLTLAMCLHVLYTRHLPAPGQAAAPGPALTPMQREVLACVARGLCDKQIAARLNLSAHTIDYHLRQLRRRFDARNRVQLAQAALQAGLG